jgi:glycerophosphoryl diester phosphodiesterase
MNKILFLLIVTASFGCNKNKSLPKVLVYGHAGSTLHRDRAVFPANSFESIQYAIDALGADGVEIDVQMTKDSVLVLYHDPFLDNSSEFKGCIGDYNYEEIKDLKLDNTDYSISLLSDVIEFTELRNAKVYLDAKVYSYCSGMGISVSTFQYALDKSLSGTSIAYMSNVYLGMTSVLFLNQVSFQNKCYEYSSVDMLFSQVDEYNFTSVILNFRNVTLDDAKKLNQYDLYWGVFGIKDTWSIDDAIELSPKFVITDNIAYTNKVTD